MNVQQRNPRHITSLYPSLSLSPLSLSRCLFASVCLSYLRGSSCFQVTICKSKLTQTHKYAYEQILKNSTQSIPLHLDIISMKAIMQEMIDKEHQYDSLPDRALVWDHVSFNNKM